MAWNRLCFTLVLLLGVSASLADGPTSQTSEYVGKGQWNTIPAPTAADADFIANPLLDHVEQMIDARQVADAHALLSPWLKQNPKAPDRDRGLYLLATIYFSQEDYLTAFYHCDELMDHFPSSRFFNLALQMQYTIGDKFLSGYKRRFLGLHVLSADDEGIEILFRVQERAPGSAIAERAMLRTADFYFRTSQFDLAEDTYGAFGRSFPRSPDLSYVKLRQAFSALAQFRGVRYDATPLIDARALFVEFQEKYPDEAAQDNVQDRIDRIDNTLAQKLYITGNFYSRTNKPLAAAYSYRYLLGKYPAAPAAAEAQVALAKLPLFAQQAPAPTISTESQSPLDPGKAQ